VTQVTVEQCKLCAKKPPKSVDKSILNCCAWLVEQHNIWHPSLTSSSMSCARLLHVGAVASSYGLPLCFIVGRAAFCLWPLVASSRAAVACLHRGPLLPCTATAVIAPLSAATNKIGVHMMVRSSAQVLQLRSCYLSLLLPVSCGTHPRPYVLS
jgi:hypothetical protein